MKNDLINWIIDHIGGIGVAVLFLLGTALSLYICFGVLHSDLPDWAKYMILLR